MGQTCSCFRDENVLIDQIEHKQVVNTNKQPVPLKSESSQIEQQFKQKKPKKNLQKVRVRSSKLLVDSGKQVEQHYRFGQLIGEGSNSTIFKVQNKVTGEVRAMKRIDRGYISESGQEKDSPFVCKFYEFFVDIKYIYIIMELIEGRDLLWQVQQMKYFSEHSAAQIMKQLLQSIRYLHLNNTVHRDLKPEKIMFTNEDADGLKLIGFGEACIINSENPVLSELVGTPYYIAPEVLKQEYNEKCDIWSCGVVLATILTGKLLFDGEETDKVLEKIRKGQYNFKGHQWQQISDEAQQFIFKLLNMKHKERISAEQALEDPWIQKYSKKQENQDRQLPNLQQSLQNLKNFKKGKILSQAIHSFIVENFISGTEQQELIDAFKQLDKNGDGRLSREEILQGYQEIDMQQISKESLDQIFQNIDDNNNGSIDFTEWVAATVNHKLLYSKERLQKAFGLFDVDDDGQISLQELKRIFITDENNKNNQEIWDELIKEFDVDSDGEISLKEFINGMQKQFKQNAEVIGSPINKDKNPDD